MTNSEEIMTYVYASMCALREQYLEYLIQIFKIKVNLHRIKDFLCSVVAFFCLGRVSTSHKFIIYNM